MRRDEIEALSDNDLLALLIYAEAGNQGAVGMLAVAHVVLNRVAANRSYYGTGARGVMLRPWQFSCFNTGEIAKLAMGDVPAAAYTIAELAMAGWTRSPVGGATHYHADYVSPYWSPSMQRIGLVGAHVFYREL